MNKAKANSPLSKMEIAEGKPKNQQVKRARKVLKNEKDSCEFRIQKLKKTSTVDEEKQEKQIEYLKQRKKLIEKVLKTDFSDIKDLLEQTENIESKMDNPRRRALRQGILSEL